MADPGPRFLGRGKPGRREQPAHESLSSRATRAEVPLTGLSLGAGKKTPFVTQGPEMHVVVERRAETVQEGDD